MPVSDAQKRALAKYRAEKVKQVGVPFYPNDMDLYEFLAKQPNKAGYIKGLIRADMDQQTRSAGN